MNSLTLPSLVETATTDSLILHGFFAPQAGDTAVLHIHGYEGNFYENHFTHVLSSAFQEKNITFLTTNNRGNGKDTTFNTIDGNEKRIGANFELLSEAYLDIDAWIKFLLDQGYTNIILQGHSLGTIKVVRYLFEGSYTNSIKKMILLAPFDKNGIAEHESDGQWITYLKEAEEKVKQGKGEEIIPKYFKDTLTMSYQNYASWYEDAELSRMFDFYDKSYDFPVLKKIAVPTKIIVGTKDPYFHPSNPEHPEEAMNILLKNIPNSEGVLIEEAEHSFAPHEDILEKEVLSGFEK